MKFRMMILLCLIPCVMIAAEDTRESMDEKDLPTFEQLRDPFWPIGYTRKIPVKVDPTKPELPPEVKAFTPNWPKLKLKAVTSSPKGFIAIIDKVGLVVEGQVVRLKAGGAVYSWRIGKISKKGFSYKELDVKPVK
jgi:hypothetical protein